MTANEKRALVSLAIGRILRLGSRSYQPGDVEEYERCRKIIIDHSPEPEDHSPNWPRDRAKGSAGD